MRVLSVVHQSDAGAGIFGEVVTDAGHELVEWRADRADVRSDPYDAVMLFGGAMNVEDEIDWLTREKNALRALVATDLPILGVCLGSQLVAEACGGKVERIDPEIGWYDVELRPEAASDPILGDLPRSFEAFEWHSYAVEPPAGAVTLARSAACLQAWRHEHKRIWGIQFHAEVTLADAERWCEGYDSDEDAVAMGVDPGALKAQTRERYAAWAALGKGICRRFLDYSGVT